MASLERADRFKINDQLPTFEEKSQETLQELMGRLAHRMSVPYGSQDNPRIPAGYTYLMQLMAHDLVQSSVAVALVGEETGGVRNHRQSRLRLDTIYGAGPDLNAFAYALEDASDFARTRLRLGRMAPDPIAGCPFRDIARVLPANQTEVALPGGYTDALIADSRNDDHAILSQFTALIHLLHNGIVANLLPKIEPHADPGAKAEAACSNFLCARAAVTLIYRNIIRKDLMQQVLHPAVYAAYRNVVDAKELVDIPDERIPLEFSHAAYRFGHCMVRNTYKINAIPGEQKITAALLTTSSRGPMRNAAGFGLDRRLVEFLRDRWQQTQSQPKDQADLQPGPPRRSPVSIRWRNQATGPRQSRSLQRRRAWTVVGGSPDRQAPEGREAGDSGGDRCLSPLARQDLPNGAPGRLALPIPEACTRFGTTTLRRSQKTRHCCSTSSSRPGRTRVRMARN